MLELCAGCLNECQVLEGASYKPRIGASAIECSLCPNCMAVLAYDRMLRETLEIRLMLWAMEPETA